MKLPIPRFLARAIVKHAKKRPFFHLDGYMNRYWFLPPNVFKNCTARVHEILRSDADRHLHDHPWGYTTIILEGGYTEVTHHYSHGAAMDWLRKEAGLEGMAALDCAAWCDEMRAWEVKVRYDAGSVLRRPANFLHRLIVEPGEVAVTLFIMGEKTNAWGFMTPAGKIGYRDYLDQDDVTKASAEIKKHFGGGQ